MGKKISEVTAYNLERACNILKKEGIEFVLREITPPFLPEKKDGEKVTGYRVLKQTLLPDGKLELIIAREVAPGVQ